MSNFDVGDLEDAEAAANGKRPACNQVLYQLRERAIEHAVLPWCEQRGIAVVGYSPFGHGDFPAEDSPGGRVLNEIANAHDVTPRQVALRFLVRRPGTFTIPKSSNPEHMTENAGAGGLELTADEIDRIDKAFPCGAPRRELPML